MSQRKRLAQKIETYITDFLRTPHPRLGNMPICPYAKQYLSQTVILVPNKGITETLKEWSVLWDPAVHKVVVLGFPTGTLKTHTTERLCDKLQSTVWERDCTVLLNHPHNPYPVANVYTGFDEGVLVILQRTSLLDKARASLHKNHPEYYANWTEQELQER